MHNEEIDSDLETFFANNEEMKEYCTHIAGEKCIHYKIRNNGNYYRIFCNEPDCPFQITYSQRNSKKFQHSFYLISQSTCLDHKANCTNSISSVDEILNTFQNKYYHYSTIISLLYVKLKVQFAVLITMIFQHQN